MNNWDFTLFPKIIENGVQWVWDYRQEIDKGASSVKLFLRFFLSEEQKEKLLKKFQGKIIECVDESTSSMRLGDELARFYGFPSTKIKIIGITGSNGKTSTAAWGGFLFHRMGFKTLTLGTLGLRCFNSKNEYEELGSINMTSPDSPLMQSLLFQMVARKIEVLVMEVSSHSLALERCAGVDFDVGVFTNLTRDHLDFHGDMEKYAQAKKTLFSKYLINSKAHKNVCAVFNGDDPLGHSWFKEFENKLMCKEFKKNQNYEIISKNLSSFKIQYTGQNVSANVIGADFNIQNFLGALMSVQFLEPARWENLLKDVPKFLGIPGRMEVIEKHEKVFFVDYAHTPDALEKALLTLKALKSAEQNLWVVFGCGGNRDIGKRPLMGHIASQLADHVILTSDNPRFEKPEKIISDIENGIHEESKFKLSIISDRAKAIEFAYEQMKVNDVCLVAGKGAETYQIIGDKYHEFDDRKLLRKI